MSHFPENPYDRIQSLSAEVARLKVPDGYVLVPKEPTQEMHDAGRSALAPGNVPLAKVYRAMLAAAHQPPNRQEDCAEPDIDPAFAEAVYGHDLDLTAMVGGAK